MCLIYIKKKKKAFTDGQFTKKKKKKKPQRAAKENIGTNVIAAQCKFPGLSSIKGKR